MTFTEFSKIVKEKHPNAELFKHGEYAGNKINVTVIFNPSSKVYQYNGTYCEVLNKLNIKAVYKHNYENVKSALERLRKTHGTESFFGFTIDNTEEIKRLEEQLTEWKKYIIV